MSTRTWLTTLCVTTSLVIPVALSNGCQQLDCAEGTIEENGACVPADQAVGDTVCGEGTQLGADGKCEPVYPPTVCDELSTTPVVDPETGVIRCEGTVTVGGCTANIPCPTAAPNKVTVCGRLYNVEDDTRIEAMDAAGIECGEDGAATGGPCDLEVEFYDALDFAGNPTGAQPLALEDFYLDDCGRYVAKNVNVPGLGFMGIGVDDKSSAPMDLHRLTGVAFPVQAGLTRNGQKTYVITRTLDMSWTTQAGLSGGTFVDRGAFFGLFHHGPNPVAGVTITAGGNPSPANDYYFTDTDPNTRTTITANGPTGPNGAGLLIGSSLVDHSGEGAEPSGCTWESALGASIPNVLFFSPRAPVDAQGNECE